MDLSVVIVCFKGYERLNRCLESLNFFTQQSFSMEVIVVNNNPGDIAIDNIEKKYSEFRFIHNSVNGGYANGCNLGCAKASGDYYLILNPDTIVREEEIIKLLDAARLNREYHILSCRQVRENGKESKAYGTFPWRRSRSAQESNTGILFPDWVSGSVMLMHKNIFQDLKGFDEDFWMYSEDVDLCCRVRESGGEIAFLNTIIIEHNHGASSRSDIKTTSVSKCEVQISRHLYIHKHEKGVRRIGIHIFMIADNLLTGIITGLIGLILFFIPKLFVRFLLFIRLVSYYSGALLRDSWLSPGSVNFKKQNSV
jgi:GT2 family glycosyltransferase